MTLMEIHVPDIGDFDEVTVIELLVKPGDSVKSEQSLITVESDKASMEIPSSHAGVVREVKVRLGEKVKQGSLVALLEVDASAQAELSGSAAVSAPFATQTPAPVASVAGALDTAVAAPLTAVQLRVPDIGDFKDVTVIEVMVRPGDAVKLEQSLITVE